MRTKARRANHEQPLGLVIIDYLQLMQGSGRNNIDNRVQVVGEISRGLKLIARELNVRSSHLVNYHVQLNRAVRKFLNWPICANQDLSNKTPISSCLFTARHITILKPNAKTSLI